MPPVKPPRKDNPTSTMLTDAQLETAAREYCRLMGWDPDLMIYPVLNKRRWECETDLVKTYFALNEALRLARGEGPLP